MQRSSDVNEMALYQHNHPNTPIKNSLENEEEGEISRFEILTPDRMDMPMLEKRLFAVGGVIAEEPPELEESNTTDFTKEKSNSSEIFFTEKKIFIKKSEFEQIPKINEKIEEEAELDELRSSKYQEASQKSSIDAISQNMDLKELIQLASEHNSDFVSSANLMCLKVNQNNDFFSIAQKEQNRSNRV